MIYFKLPLKDFFYPIFLGLLGAILFNLSFPGGPFPWLAWLAMVPVMILLGRERRPLLVCLGWTVYGICFLIGAVYWLYSFMKVVLEFGQGTTLLLIFLSVLISAVPYIITGYLAAKFRIFEGKCGALKVAGLLTAFVAYWPVPFPGDLSMSFYRWPIFTQIADIGGGHMIHFVIIWVNGLLAQGILALMRKHVITRHVWVTLICIFGFMIGYGVLRLTQYERLYKDTPLSEFVKIGYIQPNITGSDLSSIFGDYLPRDERQNDFLTAIELSKKLVEKESGLDLIAWPETPEDLPYNYFDSVKAAIADVIKVGNGVPFLFESMHPWTGISDKDYTTGKNTIYFIKNGELSYPYHKVNLIPFSEYLPCEQKCSFLREWFPFVGDVTPGDKMDFIDVNNKLRIIPLICYDGIFPEFVRRFALGGGNVFLSLDNDTNFGPTKASEVHASVMLYRSIENRIPLIRLSNSGVSFTVLSSGQILPGSETKMYKKDYRVVTILPGRGERTFYQSGGHFFPLLILFLVLGMSLRDFLKSKA